MKADLQEEDSAKTDYSLKRAKDLLLNQKDELKACNRFILEAKCQQIRKDQIAEKELIKDDEKNRLKEENEVMIQKMLDEATEYEKQKEYIQHKKKLYVQGINSQIQENKLRKQIEQEQLAEEGRLEREASLQQMLIDIEERDKKKKLNSDNVKQLNDYNRNVIKFMKGVENEEKLIEERKIKEYHEEKEKKEKEYKAEKERLRKEKEKIIKEIMDRQMKTMADAELREAIYTQYVQDLVERKWRLKEKEQKEKKMKQKKEMIEGREVQKRRKNELIAAETVAEKEEFYSRMKVLEEQKEKEIQEVMKKKEAAKKHRMELINQVNEKEVKTIEERKRTFTEAKVMKAAIEAEKKEIRENIESKIESLSDYNLPQNYQTQIRRKLMKQKILI